MRNWRINRRGLLGLLGLSLMTAGLWTINPGLALCAAGLVLILDSAFAGGK